MVPWQFADRVYHDALERVLLEAEEADIAEPRCSYNKVLEVAHETFSEEMAYAALVLLIARDAEFNFGVCVLDNEEETRA